MIEYQLDFDGDWAIWQSICHKFRKVNGYYNISEIPGWVRASDTSVKDFKIFENNSQTKTWAVIYFEREADLTLFLLRWG